MGYIQLGQYSVGSVLDIILPLSNLAQDLHSVVVGFQEGEFPKDKPQCEFIYQVSIDWHHFDNVLIAKANPLAKFSVSVEEEYTRM